MRRISILCLSLSCTAALFASAPARAQYRTTTERGRFELAFDHGYGFGTEGDYLELGTDIRGYAPSGLGAALRIGVAAQGLSNAVAADLGAALRVNLVSGVHSGLQLAGAVGPSLAIGPFDGGRVFAYGGWAMLHLNLWVGVFFVGLGVSAHALWSERHTEPNGRSAPILTIAPSLRVGFDWGV